MDERTLARLPAQTRRQFRPQHRLYFDERTHQGHCPIESWLLQLRASRAPTDRSGRPRSMTPTSDTRGPSRGARQPHRPLRPPTSTPRRSRRSQHPPPALRRVGPRRRLTNTDVAPGQPSVLSGTLAGDVLSVLPMLLAIVATAPGLRWHAPDGCPTRDDAASYLKEELQIAPETESAEVWVERTPAGWRAMVAIDSGPPRELNAASCEDVMAAAMVVIAVARDSEPQPLVPEPEPAAEAPPEPEAPPKPKPKPEPEPESEPATDFGPRLGPEAKLRPAQSVPAPSAAQAPLTHWLGVHAGVAAIHIPAPTARVGVRYELGRAAWAIRLGGHYESPRELQYADAPVGGRFQTAGAEFSGCWVPGRGAWSGAMCGGASSGAIFGFGVGLPDPSRPRGVRIGAHASAGGRWEWSDAWRLTIDGLFTTGIVRPRFHVGERAPLFQSPRFGGAGMIGIERRLR